MTSSNWFFKLIRCRPKIAGKPLRFSTGIYAIFVRQRLKRGRVFPRSFPVLALNPRPLSGNDRDSGKLPACQRSRGWLQPFSSGFLAAPFVSQSDLSIFKRGERKGNNAHLNNIRLVIAGKFVLLSRLSKAPILRGLSNFAFAASKGAAFLFSSIGSFTKEPDLKLYPLLKV